MNVLVIFHSEDAGGEKLALDLALGAVQAKCDIRLRFLQTEEERKEDLSIGRFVYSMKIGSSIPGTVVEIDAIDGTVLKWRTFPR